MQTNQSRLNTLMTRIKARKWELWEQYNGNNGDYIYIIDFQNYVMGDHEIKRLIKRADRIAYRIVHNIGVNE